MHFGMGPGGWRQAGRTSITERTNRQISRQCAFGSPTVRMYVALLQLTRETRYLKLKIVLFVVNLRFVVVLRLRLRIVFTFII